MKYLKVFESWINESANPTQIADAIQAAVGGAGTNEAALLSAIKQLRSADDIVKVNQVFKSNSKYSYKTLGQAIENELGAFDHTTKELAYSHIKKINGEAYLEKWDNSQASKLDLIGQILNRVIQHEGKKSKVYRDTKGIPTVGIGFNLNRADAAEKLSKVGASLANIKSGNSALSEPQIKALLIDDLGKAKADAQALIKNWQALPPSVQGVLVEMTFNLGKKGLSEFKNFLKHIENRQFDLAADEMLRSAWARQVGNRATTLSKIVKSA
jgi:lysozyme